MKKFIAALAGASAAFGLVACGSVESSDNAESTDANNETVSADEWKAPEGLSGSIDYYSANPQGLTDALVEAFQDRTGVTVNVFAGTTGAGNAEPLRRGRRSPSAAALRATSRLPFTRMQSVRSTPGAINRG